MWAVIKNNAIDSIIPKATTVTIGTVGTTGVTLGN